MKKRVLITGTSGFIGGATIIGLESAYNTRSFVGDITDSKDWERNLKENDVIFLIAGVRTETEVDFFVNAKSVDVLFRTFIRINKLPQRIILASSQAVYIGNKIPYKESQDPLPTTIYGKSKLLAEKLAQKWCRKFDIPLVILRYSAVLGKGVREKSRMSGPLFAWTKAAIEGEQIKVFQDGKQSRDYINIDDVVNANVLAISLPSGIYNVGGGKSVKLIELARWIKKAAKSHSKIVIMGGEPTKSDPKEMFSDIAKIKRYGWKAEKTAREAVWEFVATLKQF